MRATIQRELLLYSGSEFFPLFRPGSPHHYLKLSRDVRFPSPDREKPTFPREDLAFFYVACVGSKRVCNDVIVS